MEVISKTILACLEEADHPFQNQHVFTAHDVCFHLIEQRQRRASLPMDAKEFRILLDRPQDQGIEPWRCEVVLAVRNHRVFNPATHMRIVDCWSGDTSDRKVVEARIHDWAMGL